MREEMRVQRELQETVEEELQEQRELQEERERRRELQETRELVKQQLQEVEERLTGVKERLHPEHQAELEDLEDKIRELRGYLEMGSLDDGEVEVEDDPC